MALHLHKWGRWQDADGTLPLRHKLGTWHGPIQVRTCGRCGKTKIREL